LRALLLAPFGFTGMWVYVWLYIRSSPRCPILAEYTEYKGFTVYSTEVGLTAFNN